MSEGTRYVEVSAEAMLGELRAIGAKIAERGGALVEGSQGREIVVDLVPPGCPVIVRCYTSLAVGADAARGCGEDAIRIVLLAPRPEGGHRALSDGDRVFRTAPTKLAPEARVATFLERLRGRLRDAYKAARAVPACPRCGAAMTVRKSQHGAFHGCTHYPACRGTRPIPAEATR